MVRKGLHSLVAMAGEEGNSSITKSYNVQELVKSHPHAVPTRFVRPQEERPSDSFLSGSPALLNIPVIDMANLISDAPFLPRSVEMAKLSMACQHWGFFQAVNHGIEHGLLERIKRVGMEFFKLPLAEKQRYQMIPGSMQGYGHGFVFSDDQKLDWNDMMALGTMPKSIRKINLWPTTPLHFSETVKAYSAQVLKLCQNLLRLIAENLNLKREFLNETFGENVQAVRMNYYPPCCRPDLVQGLSAHSDGSGLTVLLQDDHSVGLQILKDTHWISVEPIPNALVVNIGDTLEVLTNGKYKSIEHRVVTNKERERLSIATFHAPSYDLDVGPLPQFIDDDHPRLYRRYKHADYNRHYLDNKLQGKKSLDFAKLQP